MGIANIHHTEKGWKGMMGVRFQGTEQSDQTSCLPIATNPRATYEKTQLPILHQD